VSYYNKQWVIKEKENSTVLRIGAFVDRSHGKFSKNIWKTPIY